MTPVLLGLIGLALALPVPAALARTSWPLLVPRAGIVLWQSFALAAVLAISGAALATALWLVTHDELTWWRVTLHLAILGTGVLVWTRFWWAAWSVYRETQARRRRQRHLVDLLGEADGMAPALRILQEETPLAYCVPGISSSRIVVSQGTISTLSAGEYAAVLEHERAHVRRRHDLVLEAFTVLHRAFPRVLRTDAPLVQSQIMVELLADDAARRSHGDASVAGALVALAGAPTPAGALGSGGAAAVRMARLQRPDPRNPLASVAAYAISVVVLVAPTVLLAIPWMLHAWQTLDL
ncbi:M56 family metallopeptidase [Aeromicrobium fastidiosum]|uniref:M56 family metallopeptidase n=1 Tax=Aeromicrobium fastidiosum TaxID=52699 RepID=A0A641AJW0_9ACTN|nr:M56 family metallopeptidase [Aeromicrobium fastidiosum]KAA1372435.1 M56 family metallopeptidase [Aeromicrobium fastidiosum]MBP2391491.1 Zn-dependent protease with chaperone function [Aeromicrobium fastidiosum]